VRIVVVGGGIAGLAAARRLEGLLPGVELTLVESEPRLGGKILTEHTAGFLVEGGPDSFLSRKARGPGLCEEVGLGDELVGRRTENARTFVRRHGRLHPLPAGLTGMVPTDFDALADNPLLSPEGRERLAAEVELAPARGGDDESVASFFTRRLGPEAYENLVEPLTTGIFAGDGDRWKTRMFAPADGVPEDPATGSAAGPLACHLARHGRIDFGREIVISQGAEIRRPSTLHARATSHRDGTNPLRREGVLPITAAIEYGAQAAAAHGVLIGSAGAGVLASMRNVRFHATRLDDVGADLDVEANQVGASDAGVLYDFRVACAGRLLAEGRVSVAFVR
jgi:hypothetical protein